MKPELLAASLLLALPASLFAQAPVAPPLLEFASGLPGKQVRLTWTAQAGVRYRIEKSTTLASGGPGSWSQVAVVDATGPEGLWLDPEATTTKAFYRVVQPQAEVFSISLPVLTSVGGDLFVQGQLIPPGSFLVLQIEGQAPLLVPLESLGGGMWRAIVTGSFSPGSLVTATGIQSSTGVLLVTLNQPVAVTVSGRAIDSPPSLPPAAPMSRRNGAIIAADYDYKELSKRVHPEEAYNPWEMDSMKLSPMTHSDHFTPQGLSRKGYDYYKAKSDMASAGLSTNPLYQPSGNSGSNPLYQGRDRCIYPADSGLPGEVSFHTCDLSLPCPAGPPLAWIGTYRSMGEVSSGHGPGWDFSYNISIQPLPASAGASASRMIVHDGGGRSDIFYRQPDGSYRCDGMFREGRFDGETFTLTFADKGKWVFRALDGSPAAGKISNITDRNEVSLACAYDGQGQLASVSDAFGRSLLVQWESAVPARILSVTSSGGGQPLGKVTYTYTSQDKIRASVSAPFVPGEAPVAGDTTYTYTSGFADARRNNNLLGISDGAGRLLEAYTYSDSSSPGEIDYDTCATYDRARRGSAGQLTHMRFEALSSGGCLMIENDELGRVTETICDRLHREVSVREYTGFAQAGHVVTSSDNRPANKLRASDPDFFQSTCDYNADSLCTRITHPDGSQELVTYDREFRPGGPVRERGNPRMITLLAPGGEKRTVKLDYQPGFGNPESAMPGGPIKGVLVKCGKSPGGDVAPQGRAARPGRNPQTGKAIMRMAGGGITPIDDWDDGHDRKLYEKAGTSAADDWESPVARIFNDSGSQGGHFFNDSGDQGGVITGRKIGTKQKAWLCSNFRIRTVSAYGQVSTSSYDELGNCTSALSPLPGKGTLFEYNALGECMSSTVLNGPGSSFRDEFNYDPATAFLSSMVCDKSSSGDGLKLTTSFERDAHGRVIRLVEPGGGDWLYSYNPLDLCVQVQSPPCPNRISTNLSIDAAGRIARCDTEHRGPDGSLDVANPAYSSFYVRDSRGLLIQVADEELPVDGSGVLSPETLGIENFAACDIGYNDAGECVALTTPAACRGQAADLITEFSYDERGLLYRCGEGGIGNPEGITTGCDYDAAGALTRCVTIASGVASPETLIAYDGFHRLAAVTDPMGNVITCDYLNDGSVVTSAYGEVNDVPGSAGNVLLARNKSQMSGVSSNPLYSSKHAINTKGTGATNGRLIAHELAHVVQQRGAAREILKSFFETGDKPSQPQFVAGGDEFFGVETKDDTITVERFSPGEAGTHPTEVTTVNRSPAGLVQSIACNGDVLATCSYDSAGRLASCSNGASTVALTRNGKGEVTVCGQTDHFFVTGPPDKTFTVTRELDALGRCIQTSDGSGNHDSSSYDSLGRCVSATDASGRTLHISYDGLSSAGPFSVQLSADADGDGNADVLSRSLIRCGECRSTTDSHGYVTSYLGDELGRVARCDYPDGTYESFAFDSLGSLHESRFADGSLETTSYDAAQQPVLVVRSNLPASISPAPEKSYGYDGLGRCVRAEQGSSLVSLGFDSCGNPTSETSGGLTIARSFDHRGRSSITYPDGRRFGESRNKFGQPLSISALTAAGTPIAPPVVQFEYAGTRVVRSTQGNGVVTLRSYRGDGEQPLPGAPDASFGECVRVTVTNAASVVLSDTITRRAPDQRVIRCDTGYSSAPQSAGRTKSFEYDALGRLTACVIKRREVNGGPVLTESSVSYTLDLEGRRLVTTGGANPGSYTQSDALPPGDLQSGQYTTWPDGALEWDDMGNLSLITASGKGRHCTCDPGYNVTSFSDAKTSAVIVTYEYDALGRRTGRNPQTGTATRFVYDGSTCIQEQEDNGSGTFATSLSFVSSGGVQHSVTTGSGTAYYPQLNTVESWGDPHETVKGSTPKDWARVGTWGDPHENVNGRSCPGGGRTWPVSGYLVTNAAGSAVERTDCDDAGKPLFLTSDGLPSSALQSSIPIRWTAPECSWEPEIGMLACPGGFYSPALGQTVTKSKIPAGFVAKKNFGQLAGKK